MKEHKTQICTVLDQVENFQIIASVFHHMGDPTRVRIFWLLCHYEACVTEIASILKMSSPAISHHLKPLKDNGLITSRRGGKEVFYRSSDTPLSRLMHEIIEEVMEISCPDLEILAGHLDQTVHSRTPRTRYQEEQIEVIHQIHDELSQNLNRRISVEDLARRYLMNPTTMKTLFKEEYGNSIAAHIREHRMEEAAKLLKESSMSIAEIAQAVGYGSQSKFTEVFKKTYGKLPKDFRME